MIDIDAVYGKTPTGGDFPLSDVLAGMKRFGISASLTASLQSAYFFSPESDSAHLAVCKEHPQLIPAASVNMLYGFRAEEEVRRLKRLGFRAARFHTDIRSFDPDIPLFREFVLSAEKAHLPILISAPAADVYRALLPLGNLTVPIILLDQDPYDHYRILSTMEHRENFFLCIREFNGPAMIDYLASRVGARRLLFGSGAPNYYIQPTINTISCSRLSDREKAMILGENARRIFGIEEGETECL